MAAFVLLIFLFPVAFCIGNSSKNYIVDFGEQHKDVQLHEMEDIHRSYLRLVKETDEEAEACHLYSYKHSFNGLAASLTPEEASRLARIKGVVSVRESKGRKAYSLHTTRSWNFLDLKHPANHDHDDDDDGILSRAKYGQDIIVGILDTGIWPESKSFSDEGMDPVPARWKGICQNGTAFNASTCNRKIIGARYYLNGYQGTFGLLDESQDIKSARDKDGHGTHLASIIAGRTVPNVTGYGGFAGGTASGGAPMARLAIYKVCWVWPGSSFESGNHCDDLDITKAFDDAIGDGVDVISFSFGFDDAQNFVRDKSAIGSLHALKKNIVVVSSAGNSGPDDQTVTNVAPWLITVGASHTDRTFPAPLVLANGTKIQGQSITPVQMDNSLHSLVLASDVEKPTISETDSGYCLDGSLDSEKVKGKIVMCLRGKGSPLHQSLEVKNKGGLGFILGNDPDHGNDVSCLPNQIPSTGVAFEDTKKLIHYIRTTKDPKARILPGRTSFNSKPAPTITSFSGRGPNPIDPNFIKPDIIAPGSEILGAWTDVDGPTRNSKGGDMRKTQYNIMSGTSVSTPHVAAAAVLIKAIHPTWSASAIKSALMTTASTTDNIGNPITDQDGKPATPFEMGSGHLRPLKAADPGLVYNATYEDYVLYTCGLGLTHGMNIPYQCPAEVPEPVNLNYPSIQISRLLGTKTVTRRVTNVGRSNSTYTFHSEAPKEYTITASPNVLVFDHIGQELSFNITITVVSWNYPTQYDPDLYYFGSYAWTAKDHVVRSPVAVSFP
ncbi:subtilisin-like protease SBT5.6 [Prosopis cineraria]|uniref:subtilisin-like protease SBT5.6 n=1 Tax=Prosopis cineraria TaxID=364024 RepID=UPI00240F6A93|nr:subtilisin-like protease SBT5.6 [Prosopis cineraria]